MEEEEGPTNQDNEGRLSERLPTSSATADARMFQEDHVATPHIAAYQVSSTRRASMIVIHHFISNFKF
jgi:phosphoglycerate dehydrogenase-like enzyme